MKFKKDLDPEFKALEEEYQKVEGQEDDERFKKIRHRVIAC